MLALSGIDSMRIAINPRHQAHLYVDGDGALCGATISHLATYHPVEAWYRVRLNIQCRKCKVLWEKLEFVLDSISIAQRGTI